MATDRNKQHSMALLIGITGIALLLVTLLVAALADSASFYRSEKIDAAVEQVER